MTENTPLTPEESRLLSRSLTQKVIDKATSDPLWKQQLLDDPEATLRAANFPELKRVEEMIHRARGSRETSEVQGQGVYDLDRLDTSNLALAPVDPYPWYPTHAVWNCCSWYTQT